MFKVPKISLQYLFNISREKLWSWCLICRKHYCLQQFLCNNVPGSKPEMVEMMAEPARRPLLIGQRNLGIVFYFDICKSVEIPISSIRTCFNLIIFKTNMEISPLYINARMLKNTKNSKDLFIQKTRLLSALKGGSTIKERRLFVPNTAIFLLWEPCKRISRFLFYRASLASPSLSFLYFLIELKLLNFNVYKLFY